MKTDENFDKFQKRFRELDPAKQIQISVELTLIEAAGRLPREQFRDMLSVGMKINAFVFAITMLDKMFEVEKDNLLRPALVIATRALGENLDKLQKRFVNLMDLLEGL